MSTSHIRSNLALRNRVCSVPEGGILFPFDDGLHGIDSAGNIIYPEEGAVATLRPREGRFGGGAVAVEEGTVNLAPQHPHIGYQRCSAIQHDQYSWTITPDPDQYNIHGIQGSVSGLDWDVLSVSYYARVTKGNPVNAGGYTNMFSPSYQFVKEIGEQWERVEVSWNNQISSTGSRFTWSFQSISSTFGESEVEVKDFQIELKPFATSFVDGSRGNGVLDYKDLPLTPEAGTIGFWMYVDYSKISGNHKAFLTLEQSISRRFWFWWHGDNDTWGFVFNEDGASAQVLAYPKETVSEGWVYFVIAWGEGQLKFYCDGKVIDTVNNPNIPDIWQTLPLRLGRRTNSDPRNPNVLFDELLILPYAATDEEIKAWYLSNAPMHNNADTYITL
jgi:hypothetical protein